MWSTLPPPFTYEVPADGSREWVLAVIIGHLSHLKPLGISMSLVDRSFPALSR